MSRTFKLLLAFLLSLVVIGCSLLPGAKQEANNEDVQPTEVSVVNEVLDEEPDNSSVEEVTELEVEVQPFVPETSGAINFSAELLAPDIVRLSWDPEADAQGYELRLFSPDNLFSYKIANLSANQNQYIDYLSPENTTLFYQLVTLTAAGESGASSLQIQTQPRNPNPLTVQASFEDDLVVTALIGPEGGVLSLTDSKGINYLLEIPANAILLEMEVSMTPVSDISNWPLDGKLLAGVHLEPDGWLLYEPAMLTITLPETSGDGLAQVGFGFNGGGEEFHLTTAHLQPMQLSTQLDSATYFVRNSNQQSVRVIRLPVMELKSNGVGESSAQNAGDLAKNNSPTDSSNANEQKAAAASAVDDELAPLLSPEDLASLVPYNIYNQIFSIKDCYDFKKASAAFQAWDNRASSQQKANWSQDLLENLGKKAVEVSKAAAEDCKNAEEGVVPQSVPCAEKLIRDIQSASTPFFQELQNAMKSNPGLLGELLKAQRELDKCPHSFKVNDAAQLGTQWLSGCIPSLNRPFQVKFKNPNGVFEYRLYPTSPFSGRIEGQGGQEIGDATMTFVYSGTYTVEVLGRDSNGKIEELDILTSMKMSTIMCTGGNCITQEDDVKNAERIPILVNPSRCEIP